MIFLIFNFATIVNFCVAHFTLTLISHLHIYKEKNKENKKEIFEKAQHLHVM